MCLDSCQYFNTKSAKFPPSAVCLIRPVWTPSPYFCLLYCFFFYFMRWIISQCGLTTLAHLCINVYSVYLAFSLVCAFVFPPLEDGWCFFSWLLLLEGWHSTATSAQPALPLTREGAGRCGLLFYLSFFIYFFLFLPTAVSSRASVWCKSDAPNRLPPPTFFSLPPPSATVALVSFILASMCYKPSYPKSVKAGINQINGQQRILMRFVSSAARQHQQH